MNNLNIVNVQDHYDVTLTPKRNENPEDANLRRFKDKILFLFTLLFITAVFVICTIVIFKYNSYSAIALNGVIGLALAVAGYYARGKNI